MVDRSSRPHRSPLRTPTRTERRIIKVRVLRRWGPARIGYLLGLHPSTVHRVLTRFGLAKLRWLDRPPGVSSAASSPPDAGISYVDVKKLGKIPAGGGWRMLGRTMGNRNSQADKSSAAKANATILCGVTTSCTLRSMGTPGWPIASCSAISARRPPPRSGAGPVPGSPSAGRRAESVDRQRILLPPHAFTDALSGIEHRRTRPYRPQTNGKVERFHRTLADEWAYARLYNSDTERCEEFPIWLHTYNHHRGHTALGGQPPATRVPNLSGQNS